ncbi:MAG: ADP-ribosylglycohydrolase family protein [Anaerolineae bacterium]
MNSDAHSLEETGLFDKIHGSMLAAAIGDAMGGPVEGLSYQQIQARYGVVEGPLPYERPPDYHAHFAQTPGSVTDDSRLRHLLCQAILDRADLPSRGDLAKACVHAYEQAQSDLERGFLEEYALAALYGEEKLVWGGQPTNGFIMANSPLGLICACDPEAAFALSYQVDFISDGYAKYSAAIAAAAVAAAMAPGTDVVTVIDAALAAAQAHRTEGLLTRQWHWYEHVFQVNERLVRTAVDVALRHRDVLAVRAEYYRALEVSPLGSEAAQTLAVALGMLVAADGDLRQALIGCVNYGRDNDSYASVAGAIAGALHGTKAVPVEWKEAIEQANPELRLRDTSLGLAQVAANRARRMSTIARTVESLLQVQDMGGVR